ncbi:uncharacterized protein DEA37_0002527 [Paragonimus westermani]|uniref:G-protein coupled receptors family 1 profile domain-containing protein n=1 Tax=Paragonimus westermani TaxID=34504 RepID=A0A5J4NYZ7_9TREM|nr:uncharacterized protein DEA37_0002527 [Paragonimus westermani]
MCFGGTGNVLLLCTLIYKQSNAKLNNQLTLNPNSRTTHSSRSGLNRRFYFKSTADYLLFLVASSEFLCLWILVLRHVIYLGSDYDVRTFNQTICVTHTFISLVSTNLAVALLCFFSAHRVISVRWPLASARLITRRCLNWCLVGVFVTILCKQIPVIFLFRLLSSGSGRYSCEPVSSAELSVLRHVYTYYEYLSHSVFGYISLIFFNAALYFVLRKHYRSAKFFLELDRLPSTTRALAKLNVLHPKTCKDGVTVAKIILLLSSVQVLSTVPYFVLVELHRIHKWNLFSVRTQLIVHYVCILAVYTNSAFSYYFVIGLGKSFRAITLEMLRFIFRYEQTKQFTQEIHPHISHPRSHAPRN